MGQTDELLTAPYARRLFVPPFRELAIIHITIWKFLHEGTGSQMAIPWILNPPHSGLKVADDIQRPFHDPVCQSEISHLSGPCLTVRFAGGARGYEVKIPWREVFPERPSQNIRDNHRVAPRVKIQGYHLITQLG